MDDEADKDAGMDNQLIKVEAGDLSKPATTLVEKISEAIGGLFKPYQMVRTAKAASEVARIEAEAKIEVSEIEQRAVVRWLSEEGKRQNNIESITRQALPLLAESAKPAEIENDWITNFFDKSRIVSDVDMQKLWAQVLGSEATTPGTFSKRTVNILADMGKEEARLFTTLCGFVWDFGIPVPIVQDLSNAVYSNNGLTFTDLSNLDALGLVRFDLRAPFSMKFPPQQIIIVKYFERMAFLDPGDLAVGSVMLTKAGQELCRVCDAEPVDGCFEYMLKIWGTRVKLPGSAA